MTVILTPTNQITETSVDQALLTSKKLIFPKGRIVADTSISVFHGLDLAFGFDFLTNVVPEVSTDIPNSATAWELKDEVGCSERSTGTRRFVIEEVVCPRRSHGYPRTNFQSRAPWAWYLTFGSGINITEVLVTGGFQNMANTEQVLASPV